MLEYSIVYYIILYHRYSWLRRLRVNYDFEGLDAEKSGVLERELSVQLAHLLELRGNHLSNTTCLAKWSII